MRLKNCQGPIPSTLGNPIPSPVAIEQNLDQSEKYTSAFERLGHSGAAYAEDNVAKTISIICGTNFAFIQSLFNVVTGAALVINRDNCRLFANNEGSSKCMMST